MNQLWANIAHTSGAKVYSMVIGVIILSLTARLLGPEGRGQVAAITTWASLFSTFAYLSLGQVALHRMAGDPTHKYFGNILCSLLLMTFILTSLAWLVAIGIHFYNYDHVFKGLPDTALMIGFIALPFLIWEQYGSSLLMGLEQIRIYNFYQVIGRTLSVVGVIVLVGLLEQGVAGVLQASLLGQMIVALGGLGFLFKYAISKDSTCRPCVNETLALLKGGAKLHLNAIGGFLFTSSSILILNHYHGPEQTAYYQMAIQLIGVLMVIPTAASVVIYGKVTSLGPNGAWPENRRVLIQITIGMICFSGFSAILAPWGIMLLGGEKFLPVVSVFRWMLLGVIGMSFSTVMAPQWIGRGYFWQTAALTFFVGLLNVFTNLALVPIYGVNGAVFAFVCTYFISIIGNGWMIWHCHRSSIN
jgi:O-antigen/teichoic acid export membrane protein